MSGQIDEVSAAIGGLQSSVDDVKREQTLKSQLDSDFRRDVRTQLAAVGLLAQAQNTLIADHARYANNHEKLIERVSSLEKRLNRFAAMGAGMLIVLSVLWYLIRDSLKIHFTG